MNENHDTGAAFSFVRNEAPRWRDHMKRLLPALIGFVTILALGCGAVVVTQLVRQRMAASASSVRLPTRQETQNFSIAQTSLNMPTTKQAANRAQILPQSTVNFQATFYPPESEVSSSAPATAMADRTTEQVLPESAAVSPMTTELPFDSKLPAVAGSAAEPQRGATEQESGNKSPTAEVEKMRKLQQANLEKSARTSRLVLKLEQVLRSAPADSERIETLLAQLSKLKGSDHPYVLKLRAYRLFKLGRFEQASRLYRRVTALKADDLEAGINLALIEMRMDHRQKAIERLDALREVYPENKLLADLLKRLRP